MKRLLLIFTATLITGLAANAQCVPDPQYTEPGVYPESSVGFNDGCVGVLYEQIVTNIVPSDTSVMIGPFPTTLSIDSLVITNVTGLPTGFTYSCNDAENVTSPADQCAFEGGTKGCISITGTPQAGDEGTYNLSFDIDVYLEGGTTPAGSYSLEDYSIVIETCAAGIFEEAANAKFKLFPNPVAESFTLEGLAGMDVTEISIINTHGQVFSTYSNITSNSFNMNVTDLDAGLYFVRIKQNDSIEMIRFIKD
jgi:hypothetical protein